MLRTLSLGLVPASRQLLQATLTRLPVALLGAGLLMISLPLQASESELGGTFPTDSATPSTVEAKSVTPAKTFSGRAKALDGDTIEIAGRKIELHGIDAPELEQVCRVIIFSWQCGEDAQKMLNALLSDHPVVCFETEEDKDGTPHAICRTESAQLNETMVRIGMALATDESPDYTHEEGAAKDENIGVWRSRFDPPWEWRAENQRNVASTARR